MKKALFALVAMTSMIQLYAATQEDDLLNELTNIDIQDQEAFDQFAFKVASLYEVNVDVVIKALQQVKNASLEFSAEAVDDYFDTIKRLLAPTKYKSVLAMFTKYMTTLRSVKSHLEAVYAEQRKKLVKELRGLDPQDKQALMNFSKRLAKSYGIGNVTALNSAVEIAKLADNEVKASTLQKYGSQMEIFINKIKERQAEILVTELLFSYLLEAQQRLMDPSK